MISLKFTTIGSDHMVGFTVEGAELQIVNLTMGLGPIRVKLLFSFRVYLLFNTYFSYAG